MFSCCLTIFWFFSDRSSRSWKISVFDAVFSASFFSASSLTSSVPSVLTENCDGMVG